MIYIDIKRYKRATRESDPVISSYIFSVFEALRFRSSTMSAYI